MGSGFVRSTGLVSSVGQRNWFDTFRFFFLSNFFFPLLLAFDPR